MTRVVSILSRSSFFQKYANSLKFFVECRAVAKLIADMKRGAVRGPAESEMRDFFSKHNLQWPRPVGDDEGRQVNLFLVKKDSNSEKATK